MLHNTATNVLTDYMGSERAPLLVEVVILHGSLYTTVNRIDFGGKAQKRLLSLTCRIDGHDVMVSVWSTSPLPLKVDRFTVVGGTESQPSVVSGEERE